MDDPGMVLSADSFLTDVCKAPFPKQHPQALGIRMWTYLPESPYLTHDKPQRMGPGQPAMCPGLPLGSGRAWS